MSAPDSTRQMSKGTRDVLLAMLVMFIYFAYMLTIAFAPEFFSAPISQDSTISIGLALGVLMAVFMVALSAWYTSRRNSRETDSTNYETAKH